MRPILRILAMVAGAATTAPAQHYLFRHFGQDGGLNMAVSRLLQDRTGFLWIGTENGLYRYDGTRFQRYGVEEGLPSASIRSLHESADGTLWVVTGGGLAKLIRNFFLQVDTGDPQRDGDLAAIDSGPDGIIYLGSGGGLLASGRRSGGVPPEFHPVPGAPQAPSSVVYVERSDTIWFGCGLDLCLLDAGRLRIFSQADGLPPDRWGALLRDRRGDLWVRGAQHLYVRPAGGGRFVARDLGLPHSNNGAMTLALDRRGRVMASTDLGLARWIDGEWELTGTSQGLESDAVTSVLRDREGSIWIGMWGAGVARWAGYEEWTSWTTADGLSNNIVWAVRRHPSGTVWVGTDRGLVRLAASSPAKTWTKQSGLAGDKVKAVTVGPDGAIWAASLPGGVTRIDTVTGKTRIYGQDTGLADDRIIALYFDAEQRLWASASEGLFRSTGVGLNLRFERQVPPGTDERTRFSRFVGDRRGRVWVGSARGLFCWEGGRWTRFSVQDGLKAEAVTHIAEDSDGAIWVAYREAAGISRLNFTATGIDVAHFNKQGGLPSDYVLFLGVDARRRLWVGTDRGVAARESGGWSVYTHEDGLVWDDCASNSFWAEPDGTVWIGTLKGLSRFHPRSNPVPVGAPTAVVTAVQYGLQSADSAARAEVSFRDHDFSVAFSGLSYVSERGVRFRYRLVGLDDRWVETGQREARYSSLPAGSYRFEVAARNPRSDWSVVPAAVSFRIVAPWWQTWWFRSLAASALAAFLVWAVRARMQQLIWERRRLEKAVRERTGELEMQKNMGERQKREIEELLRQSQEISRLKSEFLANMSHEIRTPMNGVIGMTQLVLNTSLDAEQRDYIETVRDSAEALMVVINDILDFSKIEAGKLELAHEPFPVRKCVADALMVFAWKAQERHLSLFQRVDPAVPGILVGDADRLRQVLLNLLGNAMKFTEQGEIAVSVTCPRGVAPGADGVCQVQFSVQDTGAGIPRESQIMIFEAFAQADGSIRRRQGGTGLGLAICSKLVGLMGGHISVESAPGLGSTFEFTVPLAVAVDGAVPSIESKPESLEEPHPAELPLRILLAEDNAINQRLAKNMLDKPGHLLTVVDNGRSAWEAAVSGDFDLILMDLQMPEMDGYEATARIREAELASGRHTPIVALTAHAMSGDREQCLRAGMDDYISKPIDFQALMIVIRKMAARQDTLP